MDRLLLHLRTAYTMISMRFLPFLSLLLFMVFDFVAVVLFAPVACVRDVQCECQLNEGN